MWSDYATPLNGGHPRNAPVRYSLFIKFPDSH